VAVNMLVDEFDHKEREGMVRVDTFHVLCLIG
jgi:hypothetical protein